MKIQYYFVITALLFSSLMGSQLLCLDKYVIDHAILSIYAVDVESGKVLIDQNSDVSMTPASCMKVVTTGAALNILGPNHRFETSLEYDGEIDDERTLHGNIYIVGSGDPCLGSDRISGNPSSQQQINLWADAIETMDIKKICGSIIGDATKWEKVMAVPSWSWEDVGNYYGAGASALSFHENSYSLVFKPGKQVGDKALYLRIEPPIPYLTLDNHIKTGPEGSGDCACIYGCEYSHHRTLEGTIPLEVDEFTIKGSIPAPSLFCAQILRNELKYRGIIIEEQHILETTRTRFHTHHSPVLKEIIHLTNHKSINLYAEHLLKKMGESVYQEGSTDAGVKAVKNYWNSKNINLDGFNMVDGSGLSRKNLITTKQLVEMMLQMTKSDNFPIFLETLPEKKFGIKAKTGSMSSIRGYVGFVNKIVFAILVNHCPKGKLVEEEIESILLKISQY